MDDLFPVSIHGRGIVDNVNLDGVSQQFDMIDHAHLLTMSRPSRNVPIRSILPGQTLRRGSFDTNLRGKGSRSRILDKSIDLLHCLSCLSISQIVTVPLAGPFVAKLVTGSPLARIVEFVPVRRTPGKGWSALPRAGRSPARIRCWVHCAVGMNSSRVNCLRAASGNGSRASSDSARLMPSTLSVPFEIFKEAFNQCRDFPSPSFVLSNDVSELFAHLVRMPSLVCGN